MLYEDVVIYLDDLQIFGKSEEEVLEKLDRVLCRLKQHGLKLRLSKCQFFKPEIEVLVKILDLQLPDLCPT